jgi:hypothetical protein
MRQTAICALLLVLSAPGCKRGPKTPEEAFTTLERAIAAGDAAAFYKLLDGQTRSSIADTYEKERLQRTLIEAKFPEAERPKALERLAAAGEPDAEKYFIKIAAERKVVTSYRKRLGSVSGDVKTKPDDAGDVWVARADGMPFKFGKSLDGSWGFVELRTEWALEKDRATHAVKTLRDNAALLEGAGKGGTP